MCCRSSWPSGSRLVRVQAERPDPSGRQSTSFLLLYALAWAGGCVAYAPLLTLLLPLKIAAASETGRIEWLGAATFAGAVAASIANIGFGWASDLIGTRRGWVAAGLGLTILSYGLILAAQSPLAIIAAIIVYQAALNMMLAPLAAWAADTVPDAQKGLLGGLLGAAPPAGALAGVLATLPMLPGEAGRLGFTCVLVAALVLPLLVGAVPRPVPMAAASIRRPLLRRNLILLWLARLFVQVAGNTLFAFLFYYFQSLDGTPLPASTVARLIGLTLVAAVPLALLLGHLSDKLGLREPFLVGAALSMCAGLAAMAAASTVGIATLGYAVFGCGLAIFLSLHSTFAMQLLASPGRRGRDLGIFNLTNTLPAILSPLLALGLAPFYGFSGLLAALAVLTCLSAGLVLALRSDAQTP